ncbi:MAG: PBP1A family penicillin-binding protein [bacterium]|nr:PBP1A family penicillin-binding protein [bacterium]
MFRFLKKIFKSFFWLIFSLLSFVAVGAAIFLAWGYFYITRDLPRLDDMKDYKPASVTRVFDSQKNLIAEFFIERRYPVSIKDIPEQIKRAFISAEDASFYTHPGIDLISIFRAIVKNIESGQRKQGASTITQQVVKKLLLTPEKAYERKIKEAILSYRLEKALTKDQILEIYLNQMYFGNGAYGIKAAGLVYFHKELKDITVSEAAMLAGLLKAPSRYSPVTNYDRAKKRQRYVLRQMYESGFITKADMDSGIKDDLQTFVVNNARIQKAPYFSSEVKRVLINYFGSEKEVDTGGYEVYTALDQSAEKMATKALQDGLREVDKRRGWRGAKGYVQEAERGKYIENLQRLSGDSKVSEDVTPALVTRVFKTKNSVEVTTGSRIETITISPNSWMRKKLTEDDHTVYTNPVLELVPGNVVEVSWKLGDLINPDDDTLVFDQTPEIEGGVVLLDPYTGKVPVVVGGYDFNQSQFNRITQSLRQPGSSFKPVLYLAAIDGFGYTPTTIVYDEPRTFRIGDEVWSPGNFDDKFLGAITLRNALEKSRNLASADIISRIGIDAVINYARKLGINSDLGRNPSLALGSSEVTPLEMARAYGVLAARGVLVDSVFVTNIKDRTGKEIFNFKDNLLTNGKQVVDENSAFVLTNILKGVVERGTGTKVKPIARPVAGKTGTSNEHMDAWFIGFTPEWVCVVWVGFDLKKDIGDKETGGKISAPIFLNFMKPFLEHRDNIGLEKLIEDSKQEAERLGIEPEEILKPEPADFSVPSGVDPYWVDRSSGLISCANCDGAILEYFKKGTQPKRTVEMKEDAQSYLESGDL